MVLYCFLLSQLLHFLSLCEFLIKEQFSLWILDQGAGTPCITPYLPKVVAALDAAVHVEELVEVEEDARHVGDEEHADDAHQNHTQLQILRLQEIKK